MLKHPDTMCIAEGRFEPDEISGLASEMDVVISSRLHLLILASITLTPFIGISRGSKITNFTNQFELPEIGSVDALNMNHLEDEVIRLFNERMEFEKNSRSSARENVNATRFCQVIAIRFFGFTLSFLLYQPLGLLLA